GGLVIHTVGCEAVLEDGQALRFDRAVRDQLLLLRHPLSHSSVAIRAERGPRTPPRRCPRRGAGAARLPSSANPPVASGIGPPGTAPPPPGRVRPPAGPPTRGTAGCPPPAPGTCGSRRPRAPSPGPAYRAAARPGAPAAGNAPPAPPPRRSRCGGRAAPGTP